MPSTSVFLNETKLFHGKQWYAVHLNFGNENYVDKYTRHVCISTVSFFSQLPKIKIAFNSYIYKYSDSSLYGFEGNGSIKSFNNLDFNPLSLWSALHMSLSESLCGMAMLWDDGGKKAVWWDEAVRAGAVSSSRRKEGWWNPISLMRYFKAVWVSFTRMSIPQGPELWSLPFWKGYHYWKCCKSCSVHGINQHLAINQIVPWKDHKYKKVKTLQSHMVHFLPSLAPSSFLYATNRQNPKLLGKQSICFLYSI